jgi:hypothetical protein
MGFMALVGFQVAFLKVILSWNKDFGPRSCEPHETGTGKRYREVFI